MTSEVSAEDTYAALKVAWIGSGDLVSLNGPYRDQAPANPAPGLPYAVFRALPSSRSQRSNTSQYWKERFQFVVYAQTAEIAGNWLMKIGAFLDPTVLIYTGDSSMVRMDRVLEHVTDDRDRKIARGLIEYEVIRRRPRTDL